MIRRMERAVEERNDGLRLPRTVETKDDMNAAASYLLGAVRAVMYRGGAEPHRGATGRDAQIIRSLLTKVGPEWVLEAIIGAALMRDTGRLRPMVAPGEAMTTRVLAIKWGERPLGSLAREAYHKANEQAGPRRRGTVLEGLTLGMGR